MFSICPKCGHRAAGLAVAPESCPACGIIYRKWLQRQVNDAGTSVAPAGGAGSSSDGIPARVLTRMLHSEPVVNPFIYWGRAAVFAGLVIWGWKFLRMDYTVDFSAIGNSLMHLPNLVFHEAGHVLFRPFGWFMTILGGSLGQLLVPASLAILFVLKYRNPFAAAVCTWWLGQSFMDLAPYIDDALDQKMVLIGGRTGADAPGNHDWNNILAEFNVLEKHRQYAEFADNAGRVLIVAGLLWGAVLLYRQYQRLDT